MPLDLPGLTLVRRLGEGGMGEVWLARHDPSGQAVAVKLIRPEKAAKASTQAAFAREVEAMAAMDHPGILLVFDHGLAATGEPFVVLELASEGSLDGRPPPASWAELLAILTPTLDALAHAHARGVIHRDLKPGNLLLCGPDDPRPGLKLADFGLARVLYGDAGGPRQAGTPWYMAPEQFQGRWRDLAPETDLYALGCVAWQLASGAVPFPQTTLTELRQHHVHAPLPPLSARYAVPAGFQDWLRWLLEKDPAARPDSAAAAAFELAELPAPLDDAPYPSATPIPARRSTPTFTWDAIEHDDPSPPRSVLPSAMPPARRPIPFPARWQVETSTRPPLLLTGAGLGLFAVRPAPFTARRAERSRLWDALRRSRVAGPAAVAIGGRDGVGRTRLATWIAERAAELGLAERKVIRFDPPAGALVRWLDTHLKLADLEPAERCARIGSLAVDPKPLLALEAGSLPAPIAVAAWLVAEARKRPQVVVLDDADRSPEAAAFARQLLASRALGAAPILLVATLAEGADPGPFGDEPLNLAPLGLTDAVDLLAGTLDLEPAAAGHLHVATDGNPGLMLQIVGDWVVRGALRPGPHGFSVDPAATRGLPASLSAAWSRRVEALLDRLAGPQRHAVALAATHRADPGPIWSDLATRSGADPERAVAALVAAGFASRRESGWTFADAAAQAALVAALRPEEVSAAHRAWVAALPEAGDQMGALADHLFAVGAWDRAAACWMNHTTWSSDRGAEALSILDRVDEAHAHAQIPEHHPRALEVRYRRAVALSNLGKSTAADELERLQDVADAVGAPHEFCQRVASARSQLLAKLGRVAEAEAIARAQLTEDPGFAKAWVLLGMVGLMKQDFGMALEAMTRALPLTGDDAYQRAAALTGLAEAHRHAGDLDRAQALHHESYVLSVTHGWRDALTSALNLAQLDLERERWLPALTRLEELIDESRRRLEWFQLLASLAMAAHATARLGRWGRYDELFALIPGVDRIVPTPEPDIATHLLACARVATAAGHPARARAAAARGRRHAEQLGLTALLTELDGFLA